MSFQITEAFVQQYKGNVISLYQQKGSVLKGLVREETITGKAHFFERLGATAAVKRTTRHADTPQVDSPHSRRMVTLSDWEWADLVDQQDKIRLLISPESEYAVNGSYAMKRAYDDEVIAAFDADAKAGDAGQTTVTFATEKLGDVDPSAADVALVDILTAKAAFDNADIPAEGRVALVVPDVITQLLQVTQVSSSDYNTIKALVKGEIDQWLGFTWRTSTRLPTVSGDTDRYNFFYHRDSMAIAVGKDMMTRITERSDKSYAVQVYLCQTLGATRVQGNGVYRMRTHAGS